MTENPRAGGLSVLSPVSSRASSQRQLGRSILAVLAGMAAGIAITLITDLLLRKAGVLPPLGERVPDRDYSGPSAPRVTRYLRFAL